MSGCVKFAESEDGASAHDSNVVVREMGSNHFAVNLGFLKHNHKYQITFVVPDQFRDCDLECEPLQSLYIVVDAIEAASSTEESPDGHRFKITLTAAKEKLMRETLLLTVVAPKHVLAAYDGEPILRLQINARVLGRDKGTPALKTGIRSVGVEVDEDSEQSDWQGFDA